MIDSIKVRGARVHNLKAVDVDIPLNQIVGIDVYKRQILIWSDTFGSVN